MKILITGFSPFGGSATNASLDAVRALPCNIADAEIVTVEIPTVFRKSIDCLRNAIKEHQPDVVICVGQSGSRSMITPERVAINLMDARIPDNEGNQPRGEPIAADGPDAYFSTLPIKDMVSAMQKAGIPSEVSNTAGTYVCNQLMYGLLHIIHTEHPEISGGFIHVPLTSVQAALKKNAPGMAISDITKGLLLAIEQILKNLVDSDTPRQ